MFIATDMVELADPMTHVRVTLAQASERPLLERLLQFYLYDFSELEAADSDALDFDEHGGYGPTLPPAAYWTDPDWHAHLIRVGEKIAGFAFIDTHSHTGGRVQHNMAEFFVARKFRRRGVARESVRQILALLPGSWEVAVKDQNTAAKAFWPRAISAAGVADLTVFESHDERWRGPIWTFSAA
jgi:predicted acetyltransferase